LKVLRQLRALPRPLPATVTICHSRSRLTGK
jgi:hypothetical protein